MRTIVAPEHLPVSQTANPYWDMVRTIPGNAIDWKYEHVWSPDWTASFLNGGPMIDRHELCAEYTWAIPDPASIEFVAEWIRPCAVELGAGRGYWAWQVAQLGVDMLCFDIAPPDKVFTNHWHSPRSKKEGEEFLNQPVSTYHSVEQGDESVLLAHADRVLFLCWPPMSDMALNSLNSYMGKRLVYIGEGSGGCTANDEFHERLENDWHEVATHRPAQWWGIHDWITVYER